VETQAIPDEEEKIKVNFLRYKAKYYVRLSPEVEQRALQFIKLGVKPMDALQLASAERGAEVFITVGTLEVLWPQEKLRLGDFLRKHIGR
jgi:predicted nucleic acid-binding protein